MVKKLPAGMRPLKGAGDPYSDAVRAKIKGSASPKRKLAQKISHLKDIKNPTRAEQRIMEIVRDPEASAFHIQRVIEEVLEEKDLPIKVKIELLGKMVQAHVAFHGSKSKNLNVTVDVTSDKVLERLKEWKQKEYIIIADLENERGC